MAELGYNDVYRAAHDATRDIRDMLGRILTHVERIDDIQLQTRQLQRSVDDIRRNLLILTTTISSGQKTTMTATPPYSVELQQVAQVMRRVEVRVQQVEVYLQEVGEYFSALRQHQFGPERLYPRTRAADSRREATSS